MKTSVQAATAAVSLTALLLLGGCAFIPPIPSFGNGDSSSDNGSNDGFDEIDENPFLDNTVPEGFPAEVPLPDDLEIYLGLSVAENSWTIIYKADDLEIDFNIAVETYEAEGWEIVQNNQAEDSALGVFTKGDYTVQVMGLADGSDDFDGPSLSYTVVRAS